MARRVLWLALGVVVLTGCVTTSPTPPRPTRPAGSPVGSIAPSATPTEPAAQPLVADLRDAGRIDVRHGWVLTAAGLALTDDGGATWRDATPDDAAGATPYGALFADAAHGWLATAIPDPRVATYDVWRTTDGGRSWADAKVAEGINRGEVMGWVSFSAVDGRVFAFVQGGMPTGYTGDLSISADDGATWTPAPMVRDGGITGPVAFADRDHGVVAGGAPGDRLFDTGDGGATWRLTPLPAPVGVADRITQFGVAPTFWSGGTGGVPVIVGTTERATNLLILVTGDAGATWRVAGSVPLGPENGTAVAALLDASHWLVVAGGSGVVRTDDGGTTWEAVASAGLPAVPDELSMVDPTHGWAIVRVSGCATGKSDCSTTSAVESTDDGGATWTPIWPPRS